MNKKLSEVAKLIMGQSPSSQHYNQNREGLPFYQGKTDFGTIHPTPTKWCSSPIKIAEKNDILISVRAPVGTTNICEGTSCIGRGIAAIRAINVNYLYLFFYLRAIEEMIASLGKGSTFKSINKSELENLNIYCPPLPEQEKFAKMLLTCHEGMSLAEEKKELYSELNKYLLGKLTKPKS